ncbi:unannotated protein [freshwater metagenome]|uniref:Unannotated protein n=1 Tax=freshwater metagenome TaxID=449393 RepID=A0A6J6XWR2_9ZZZZ
MECVRDIRRRRDALVIVVGGGAARWRFAGVRERYSRVHPSGDPAAVEQLVLPHAVCQRREQDRRVRYVVDQRDRSLRVGQDSRLGRLGHGRYGFIRSVSRLQRCTHVPRCAHQLVHPSQPRSFLGGRSRSAEHVAHGAERCVHGCGAVASADQRSDLPRSYRRTECASTGLARRVVAAIRSSARRRHGSRSRCLLGNPQRA